MDALTRLLVAVRDELLDVAGGQLVLVACSGGPDSLALAAATARLGAPRGWRTGAIVIDHGWSADASAAGARTAGVLRDLGLAPVELIAVDCGPQRSGAAGGGPEAAARTARYQALDDAADRLGAAAVLLGHTLDDQAETVLLGLGRGSGGRSLAGMPRRRGRYRRPLLALRRTVTVAACAALELDPWHDPANHDDRFTRVRVRHLADALESALGPGVMASLARTADLLREDADALDDLAARVLERAASTGPDRGWEISTLLTAPAAIRRRALLAAARAATSALTGERAALTRAHALALDELLTARDGAQAHLPFGVIATRACGRVQFSGQPPVEPPPDADQQ